MLSYFDPRRLQVVEGSMFEVQTLATMDTVPYVFMFANRLSFDRLLCISLVFFEREFFS
jgi:hypothetical protein